MLNLQLAIHLIFSICSWGMLFSNFCLTLFIPGYTAAVLLRLELKVTLIIESRHPEIEDWPGTPTLFCCVLS